MAQARRLHRLRRGLGRSTPRAWATEIGLYKDPYSKFGQLTYEIWRAIRLVVDTGMHAMGWTRQQAIDYFKANSAKAEHDIEVEIDRYIVWPGQALAYKIGELKLKELRAYAREGAGRRSSTSAPSTTTSSATAPCRSTCWRRTSRRGWRR